MAINPKVKDIIVEQLNVDPDKVKPEASFIDDLGAELEDGVRAPLQVGREAGWVGVQANAQQAVALPPGSLEGGHEMHVGSRKWRGESKRCALRRCAADRR